MTNHQRHRRAKDETTPTPTEPQLLSTEERAKRYESLRDKWEREHEDPKFWEKNDLEDAITLYCTMQDSPAQRQLRIWNQKMETERKTSSG